MTIGEIDHSSTTQRTSDQANGAPRSSRLRGTLVLIVAFAVGAGLRDWFARRELGFASTAFPVALRYSSPLIIDVEWRPELVSAEPESNTRSYSGPAKFTLQNSGRSSLKVALPPQSCFYYSSESRSIQMSARSSLQTPRWAKEATVLTLDPGESRIFEEPRFSLTTSQSLEGNFQPGPLAFDFAAPPGAAEGEYVTGTVFSWQRIVLPD